eukprot:11226626-Lingulodinium_polyedra.AAC.1
MEHAPRQWPFAAQLTALRQCCNRCPLARFWTCHPSAQVPARRGAQLAFVRRIACFPATRLYLAARAGCLRVAASQPARA